MFLCRNDAIMTSGVLIKLRLYRRTGTIQRVGSSSGSAASVAAGHVPLSLGSQTNGSVIRPASFCGVYGFKPSAGVVSRRGVLETCATLDQVGVFGRDVADIALLVDSIAGYDGEDSASFLAPKPAMLQGYQSEVPAPPTIAWIDMPYAERYAKDAVERLSAPPAKNHTEEQYLESLEMRSAAIDWFGAFFHDYDAILTPLALSEAPLMGSTADLICCTVWTLCGLPCLSMPLLKGANGLPIGVQLVGALCCDDRWLRTSRYVLGQLRK